MTKWCTWCTRCLFSVSAGAVVRLGGLVAAGPKFAASQRTTNACIMSKCVYKRVQSTLTVSV